jgi:hypothetical protein
LGESSALKMEAFGMSLLLRKWRPFECVFYSEDGGILGESSTLKMEAIDSPKTAVNLHLFTRLHIPADGNGKSHTSRTLKSRAQEQNLKKKHRRL